MYFIRLTGAKALASEALSELPIANPLVCRSR
jgi:hypothetical protein